MTAALSIRFVERFPEPGFAELQRDVFAPLERPSAEFTAAVRADHAAGGSIDPGLLPPMVRFGAYSDEQLVGWTYGFFQRLDGFYMANSGVLPSHRRRGLYSQLVAAITEYAHAHGAVTMHSQHSVLNTPVILAKLKLGFIISGTTLSEDLGLQVQLVRHRSALRADAFRDRAVPFVRPSDA